MASNEIMVVVTLLRLALVLVAAVGMVVVVIRGVVEYVRIVKRWDNEREGKL